MHKKARSQKVSQRTGLRKFSIASSTRTGDTVYTFSCKIRMACDELGLAVAVVAIINLMYAVWNAVNDPLVSYLSD